MNDNLAFIIFNPTIREESSCSDIKGIVSRKSRAGELGTPPPPILGFKYEIRIKMLAPLEKNTL